LNPTSKPLSAQQQQQQQQQQFKDFKQNQTRKSLTKNLEFQSPMFYQLVSRAWNERDSSLPHTFFFFFFFLINQHTHTHTEQKNSFQTLKEKKTKPTPKPKTQAHPTLLASSVSMLLVGFELHAS
jgi:hypothetical protein